MKELPGGKQKARLNVQDAGVLLTRAEDETSKSKCKSSVFRQKNLSKIRQTDR